MPEKVHKALEKQAEKEGLTGDEKNAYVYGTLAKLKKKMKEKGGDVLAKRQHTKPG